MQKKKQKTRNLKKTSHSFQQCSNKIEDNAMEDGRCVGKGTNGLDSLGHDICIVHRMCKTLNVKRSFEDLERFAREDVKTNVVALCRGQPSREQETCAQGIA